MDNNCGTYRVIGHDEIAPIPDPGFPHHGHAEDDYRRLLEASQSWFSRYPNVAGQTWVGMSELNHIFVSGTKGISVSKNSDGQ